MEIYTVDVLYYQDWKQKKFQISFYISQISFCVLAHISPNVIIYNFQPQYIAV